MGLCLWCRGPEDELTIDLIVSVGEEEQKMTRDHIITSLLPTVTTSKPLRFVSCETHDSIAIFETYTTHRLIER